MAGTLASMRKCQRTCVTRWASWLPRPADFRRAPAVRMPLGRFAVRSPRAAVVGARWYLCRYTAARSFCDLRHADDTPSRGLTTREFHDCFSEHLVSTLNVDH